MYAESRLTHNWLIKHAVNEKVRPIFPRLSGTVLDLGCGTRPFESDIRQHAENYIGVDWQNTIHAETADIVANLNLPLPIKSESVDHIVSFEVLEHLSEPTVMLTESYRILRRNGILLISTPFQWWIHEAPWDFQRFTRHGLEHQLSKAGFSEICVMPTTGFWSMWFLKFNYKLNRLCRGSRLKKLALKALLLPVWWTDQHFARIVDRRWPDERETAGYVVVARKVCP